MNKGIPGNDRQDWENAELDFLVEERIKEEAFLHYLMYGTDSESNWFEANKEMNYRLNLLAFYLHESNINRSPVENWKEAQRLYIEKF